MALQIRRGTEAQRAVLTGVAGELLYTTDTKKLYVGDGVTAGGTEVAIDLTGAEIKGLYEAEPNAFTDTKNTKLDGIENAATATDLTAPGAIGSVTPSTGAFTTLTSAAGSAAAPALTTTGDTNTGIFFPAADTIGFSEGGTEAMRITSAGDVGIGTSSPDSSNKLQVAGDFAVSWDANKFIGMKFGAGGAYKMGMMLNNTSRECKVWSQSSDSDDKITFYTGPTPSERMRINSSGGLILVGSTAQKATGTTWSNPSDERLKGNIRDYGKGLAELMQVRVREWEYNGKGGTVEGTKGLGVVADEVMAVLPDTVENYDAKLNADDEEVTAIKKFDATEITWLLVKTVQEQQALIQSLTARITTLEGNTP